MIASIFFISRLFEHRNNALGGGGRERFGKQHARRLTHKQMRGRSRCEIAPNGPVFKN
jgi:hypothetical protein